MALTRPFPIDKAYPNAIDLRKAQSTIFPREGIFPDATTIAAAGIAYGNGAWNVAARPFTANVKRGGAPYSMAYGAAQLANDAAMNAWVVAGAPTSGVRIDRLWVRATDPTQAEATTTPAGETVARAVPVYGITTGVAGAGAPALPPGTTEIAQVSTPAGAASIANSTITQTYKFANVAGGTIYVRNRTELDALVGAIDGDRAFDLGADIGYRNIAGAWHVDPGTMLGRTTRATQTNVAAATEVVVLEVSSGVSLPLGAKFTVAANGFAAYAASNFTTLMRHTTNNTAVATTSPTVGGNPSMRQLAASGSVVTSFSHETSHVVTAAGIHRVALCFATSSAGTGAIWSDSFDLVMIAA